MSALHSFNLSWKYSFVVAGLFVASFLPLRGQRVAVKTNLLADATTTFNIGVELALHPKWTLDVSGNYNPWTFRDNRKWQHWLVQPEARYWFCQKMSGHFLGFHVEGGAFNIGNLNVNMKLLGTDFRRLKDKRYEGWLAGGGIGYGYSWMGRGLPFRQVRCLPVRPLRKQARTQGYPPLLRSDEGRHQFDL